jgi:hypothetical protein
VIVDGVESSGASKENSILPVGTIVTTGEDGRAVVEVAPGIIVQLEPNTQITIGETTFGDAVDPLGNPIPTVSITLTAGTIVTLISEAGFLTAALEVVTPRGNISPSDAGNAAITVTGTDPATATVTIVAADGAMMATTTAGEFVPVPDGLAVILTPDGERNVLPAEDVPGGPALLQIIQNAAASVAGLDNLTPATPPAVEPATDAAADIPVNQPSSAPTPTPTPGPTPTPTPSPTPTPVSP